jgi:multiple sugar transport system permease protein
MNNIKHRGILKKITNAVIAVIIVILCLGPIFWGVDTSLKKSNEILIYPPELFGSALTLIHYQEVLDAGFLVALKNSIFYAVGAIIIGLIFGNIAAYGFDRFRFPGRKILFFLVVASIPMSIGSSSVLIPTYLYLCNLGMTDKWYTLPLLYTVYNLPMAIWILKGSYEMVPKELDEAAKIDGCSNWLVLWKICLPLVKPAMVSAAMFLFIGAWNDFISASVMVTSSQLRTVQLAIYNYLGFFGREWGQLTASASLALVPVILLFMFLGRFLISGLTKGAVNK